jgi:RNA polymerase sigma-70 factor (ECF subfamily)
MMAPKQSNRRTRVAEAYEDLRPPLFSIAYRMLGSVAEAEDIVQEAFLRYQRALEDGVQIESPKAYLSAVTTRLAIDHLRSARVRKETYVGEWLPEPLLTDESAPDAARHAEDADSLSMAFLLLLERLSPVERGRRGRLRRRRREGAVVAAADLRSRPCRSSAARGGAPG